MSKATIAKGFPLLGALVVLQTGFVAAWLLLRSEPTSPPVALVRVSRSPLPPLRLDSSRGAAALETLKGPLLLHFWATWCVPCRDELPRLLAAADDEDVAVIAVSVDENQRAINAFFDGEPPPEVWRASHAEARASLQVESLPVTFFVDADGQIVARTDLAQVWTAANTRSALARALARDAL